MRNNPLLVVVAEPDDLLSDALVEEAKGIVLERLRPEELGSLPMTADKLVCRLNRRDVNGVIFRVAPTARFAGGYEQEEQAFADSELSAIWLSVLNLGSVWAVNRYDAEMWYDGLRWPVWQRRIARAGIPVSPAFVGASPVTTGSGGWMPYGGQSLEDAFDTDTHAVLASAMSRAKPLARNLTVCGRVIDGEASGISLQVAEYLEAIGLRFAEIELDQTGRVFRLNPLPRLSDHAVATMAARCLLEAFNENLCHRRLV
jgi:hypothetical protein